MSKEHIVILGAGLMGRLFAFSFARAGFQVSVYDKGAATSKDSAAYAAAAMLAPMAESIAAENSIISMGLYSLARWPEILAELSQPIFFQKNGSLILWHQQDQSLGKHFYAQLCKTQKQYPKDFSLEKIQRSQIMQLENQIDGRFREALYLPNEGQLDNRELLESLLADALLLGVNFYWHSPKEIDDFENKSYFYLLDCRGLGARTSLKSLRGVRGEVIRVYAPEVTLHRPIRLLHPRFPIYIAPKKDHLYVIGATEIESEDMSEVSVRSTLELLTAAYSLHSGFAEGRILELNAQCRPTLPDNAPLIERLNPRVIRVNGLYRHGFMISPAILDTTLEIVLNDNHHLSQQFSLESPFSYASHC